MDKLKLLWLYLIILVGFACLLNVSQVSHAAEKPDTSLATNFVPPSEKDLESIVNESKTKGLNSCIDRLYPKGNLHAHLMYPIDLKGEMAKTDCGYLYAIAFAQYHQVHPNTKLPMEEEMKRQMDTPLMRLMTSCKPPASDKEKQEDIALCENKGSKAMFLKMGATEKDIDASGMSLPGSTGSPQMHDACTNIVDSVARAHE